MLRRNLLLACLLGSAVAQTSVSQTQSPTGSTTPSATATPTTSATPSITQTASASGTRTASQFRTASQSTSASQTQTQSITPPPVLEFGGGFLPSNWSIAPGFPSPTFVSVSTPAVLCLSRILRHQYPGLVWCPRRCNLPCRRRPCLFGLHCRAAFRQQSCIDDLLGDHQYSE